MTKGNTISIKMSDAMFDEKVMAARQGGYVLSFTGNGYVVYSR